jgi:hypothetical protein
VLRESGQLDALLASCARFAEHSAVLSAQRQGRVSAAGKVRIGPPLVFQRLWEELGLPKVLGRLLAERKFGFDVERAIFLTVLHRLFAPGSDRAAEVWRERYAIAGAEGLQLHHLYRAMAWLGEPLPEGHQAYATPFAPRCVKDLIEEALFAQTRDLFTSLELVFFDTTSIYFEGEGGQSIGQYGHSKDHRGDCKQIVVAVVLDGRGRPICCGLWPGNTTDVKTLLPVIDRLKQRFHITSICIVADRGMISARTIDELQAAHRDTRYILGARLRAVKEIYGQVLSRPGRYREVYGPRQTSKDPSPLKVKIVPQRQVGAGNPADLPQVRRDDPRPRLLQLPGVDVAEGTAGTDRAARLGSGVGTAPRRPRLPGRNHHSHRGPVVRGPQRHGRRGGQSDPGRRRGPRPCRPAARRWPAATTRGGECA